MFTTDTHSIMEEMFSGRSVPRTYNKNQIPMCNTLSSERILHEDYGSMRSVEKISGLGAKMN